MFLCFMVSVYVFVVTVSKIHSLPGVYPARSRGGFRRGESMPSPTSLLLFCGVNKRTDVSRQQSFSSALDSTQTDVERREQKPDVMATPWRQRVSARYFSAERDRPTTTLAGDVPTSSTTATVQPVEHDVL